MRRSADTHVSLIHMPRPVVLLLFFRQENRVKEIQ